MRTPAVVVTTLVATLLVAPEANAQSAWTVGYDGPTATVSLTNGTVQLAVADHGHTVLQPSPVGIVTERADLSKDLRLVRRTTRPVVERYATEVGKDLDRTAVMTETRFTFQGEGRLDLIVRASRDGIAYRYALPGDTGAILRETSAYNVPAGSTAWLAKYRVDYENTYAQTTSDGADTAEFEHPALFDVDGTYLHITESDVDGRDSAARLVHDKGVSTYRIKYFDDKVQVNGPGQTAWRTMIVGDLATVTGSTLVNDLATPSKIGDTSWIQPGKVFWSWLAGGREAGESLPMQKGYVDYAAAHGWPYVLVDAGWYFDPNWDYDPTWETTSWIPQLVQYAKARNVRIQVWMHYDELDTEAERQTRLALLERWGVRAVKIDFMNADGQAVYQWYDQILPELAQHHLMVNFHGSTIPHGLQRTWPNVMTMEGVYGAEHSSGVTTTHLTALPFTRNVPGSMDYTPMAWSRANRPTSDAHELALSVVFESGFQNFAGAVPDYQKRPEAERFLDQVPTVWDESRLLTGRPGDSAVFARKSGDRWFVGGGFSGAARTASVPLKVDPGLWLVDMVKDGPAPGSQSGSGLAGDGRADSGLGDSGAGSELAGNGQVGTGLAGDSRAGSGLAGNSSAGSGLVGSSLVREQRVMWAGSRLTVDVAKDGGFAAIACRWYPGVKSCDRPVRTIPSTAVTATPQATTTPGSPVTITGKFTVDTPVTGVSLFPRVPAGWTVTGSPVTAARVKPGQELTGTWTVTAPETYGYTDIPVVAKFDNGLEDEQVTRVHVWKPLPAGWFYVSDLPFTGAAQKDLAANGNPIAIRRVPYGKGLGAMSNTQVQLNLDNCTEFVADVGVDDQAGLDVARQKVGGTAGFVVQGDGKTLVDTGTMGVRTPARTVDVDVTGVRTLTLMVTDGGDGIQNDRASWGDARVHC